MHDMKENIGDVFTVGFQISKPTGITDRTHGNTKTLENYGETIYTIESMNPIRG